LREAAASLGVSLEPGAVDRIGRFLDLLLVWNRRLRLTGDREGGVILRKHVVDSLALVPHLPRVGLLVDVGAGAGFPGIVLACEQPERDVLLIESRRRPVSFLREVIRGVPLPRAVVLEGRAEDVGRYPAVAGRAAAVISRAIRLDVLLSVAGPFLAPSGRVIAMQTPRTAAQAAAVARTRGFELGSRHDYRLPDGELRSLVTFVPVR
jgi:16S rRNA (guanine527-N7)-methyltransferase